jgi:hypothetical protein
MATMSTEQAKPVDGGFLSGMTLGLMGGMFLGAILVLMALLSVPG